MLRSLALLVAVGAARAYRPALLAPLHANHAMAPVTRQARAPVLQADRAPPPSAPVSRALRAAVGFVDRRYFLVGIGCAIGLAAGNPAFGRVAGPLRPELTVSWGASCAIFLISGLTLPTSALAAAARRVKLHAAVQSFNLGLIPLGALGFTTILSRLGALAPEACAGLLAMSALPTTINMCIALTRSAGPRSIMSRITWPMAEAALSRNTTPPLVAQAATRPSPSSTPSSVTSSVSSSHHSSSSSSSVAPAPSPSPPHAAASP